MALNQPPRFSIQSRPTAAERISVTAVRRWAMARHELMYVAWALMDVALIVPLGLALMPAGRAWSPGWVSLGMLAVVLLPFYTARLLTWLEVPLRRQQRVLIGLALLVILWSIRTINYETTGLFDFRWIGQFFRNLALSRSNSWQFDLVLFLMMAVAWWRGVVLVSRIADVVRFGDRFRRGGLVLLPFVVIVGSFRLAWSVLPFVLLFFLAGLTAVVLTRAEHAERNQAAIIAALSPRWLLTVLGAGTLIVFLPSAVSRLISGDAGTRIAGFLEPLWQAVRFALSSIGLTLAFIASPFLDALETLLQAGIAFWQWAFSRMFVPVEGGEESESGEEAADEFGRFLAERLAEETEWLINWRLVLLIALVVLVIVTVYALGRYYQKNLVAVEHGRSRPILDRMISRLSPARRRQRAAAEAREFDWKTAVTIERIYEQMLRTATRLGHPRQRTETPYEHLRTLQQLWPDHGDDVRIVTRAFVRVRYGELPESRAEFEQIKTAWKQIEQTAKAQMKQEKDA